MHRFILFVVFLFLLIQTPVFAQSSSSDSFDGNLGSWTWGKKQAPPSNDYNESDADIDEGRGETSWERMTTERSEETEPSSEEEPKHLTPLDLWRFVWGKISNKE